ncbi:MAG: hypothetical protein U0166_12490 [Acidobacteriota bacterium]
MSVPSRRGRALRRAALLLGALASSYLVAGNAFLMTPISDAVVNRRRDKVLISWDRAFTILPGRVEVRGLRVEGHARRAHWVLFAQSARGWVSLPWLFARRIELHRVRGNGVRVRIEKPDAIDTTPSQPRRHPWTFALDGATVEDLREISIGSFKLEGVGRAAGGFRRVMGSSVEVLPSEIAMEGDLSAADVLLVRGLRLDTKATLASYVPRDHPGLAGFDFLTASLRVAGTLEPGSLDAEIVVDQGKLAPGTRIAIARPAVEERGGPAPSGAPLLSIQASVAARPRLSLVCRARDLVLGPRLHGPPLLESGLATLAVESDETRLSALLSPASDPGELAQLPLLARAEATDLALASAGGLEARLEADRATAMIDVAGLLSRRLSLRELRAEGVDVDLSLSSPSGEPPSPWTVVIDDASVSEIRSLRAGDMCLRTAGRLLGSIAVDSARTIAIPRLVLDVEGVGDTLGGSAAAHVDLHAEPFGSERWVEGASRGVSGTVALHAQVPSLAFLGRLFHETPWLGVDGSGALTASLGIADGRLQPGSRLSVRPAKVAVRIFESEASGSGVVEGSLEDGSDPPRVRLTAELGAFALRSRQPPSGDPYVTGSRLTIDASSERAVDLESPVTDLVARIEIPGAIVPDMRAYNALLPADAGVKVDGGSGRLDVALRLDAASNKGTGSVRVESPGIRVLARDLSIDGGLRLDVPIALEDVRSRSLVLDGMVLTLDPVVYSHADDAEAPRVWSGRVAFPRASAVWGEPLSFHADAELGMKNVGPLIALFAPQKSWVAWLVKTLKIEQVNARAALELAKGQALVKDLDATGGDMSLKARLRLTPRGKDGDLLVSYKSVSVGLEVRNGERDWKILRPEGWFSESSLP